MIKINLVREGRRPVVSKAKSPKKLDLASGENAATYALAAALAVGLAVFGTWWFLLNGTIKDNDGVIREKEKRVAELQEIIQQVEEFERRQAELELKIDVITDLKNNQRGPVEIMDRVSEALPELLWIDRLVQNGPGVTVTGRAFNTNAVSNFLENIDQMPEFAEPVLLDTTRTNGDVYSYTITFTKQVMESEESEA